MGEGDLALMKRRLLDAIYTQHGLVLGMMSVMEMMVLFDVLSTIYNQGCEEACLPFNDYSVQKRHSRESLM